MVQFINLPSDNRFESLGQALGMSLGKSQETARSNRNEDEQKSLTARFLSGTSTPEEEERLNPETRIEIEKLRSRPAPGGLGGVATPPEITNKINEIVEANPEASALELGMLFNKSGIPEGYTKSTLDSVREKDALKNKTELSLRKEKIQHHKDLQKYDDKLTDKFEGAGRKIKAIEKQFNLQKDIGNWDRIVGAVFRGSPMEDLLKTKSAQEFDSYALPMIEGQKENFGVRLSDADLRLVLQKIATSTKNPEANKAILKYQLLESTIDRDKRKIADEIKKESGGLRPLDFQEQLRKKIDEKYGDEIQAAADKILSLDGDVSIYGEERGQLQRELVQKGTKLNNNIIDKYLKLASKDADLAMKMAREDGYEF